MHFHWLNRFIWLVIGQTHIDTPVCSLIRTLQSAFANRGMHDRSDSPLKLLTENHGLHAHAFLDALRVNCFRQSLLSWYDKNKRTLPWRKPFNKELTEDELNQRGYEVWVSEIMLQQTQVNTVIDYYNKWMQKWPTVKDLGTASLDEVRQVWSGLGYYSRASRLLEGAKCILLRHTDSADTEGRIPRDAETLLKTIPGVGQYTAGAISSIAFNRVEPVVDGNVLRLFSRYFAIASDVKQKKFIEHIWKLAKMAVDLNRPGDFNQGLMDLGATICTPSSPLCEKCPLSSDCLAYRQTKLRSTKSFLRPKGQGATCDLCAAPPLSFVDDIETAGGVTYYPLKTNKSSLSEKSSLFVILEHMSADDSRSLFLLEKRPEKGLLAGLWQLLEMDITGNRDMLCALEKLFCSGDESSRRISADSQVFEYVASFLRSSYSFHLDNNVSNISYLGSFIHLFTHIKQTCYFVYIYASSAELVSKVCSLKHAVKWLTRNDIGSEAVVKSTLKAFKLYDIMKTTTSKSLCSYFNKRPKK